MSEWQGITKIICLKKEFYREGIQLPIRLFMLN